MGSERTKMTLWHEGSIRSVVDRLNLDPDKGLESSEANRRLKQMGPNEIRDRNRPGPIRIFVRQFKSLMVAILIVAGLLSLALGDTTNAAAIIAIVVLNALLSFPQEYRAQGAIAALKELYQPVARVRRDGVVLEIPSRDLVSGDVILLETGNLVSADARLLEAVHLRTQESALTGESEPIAKDAAFIPSVGHYWAIAAI
jgi:Ca2+-transporting ATPase